jgi:eukaryotic-like serine/threonine-protein kinase
MNPSQARGTLPDGTRFIDVPYPLPRLLPAGKSDSIMQLHTNEGNGVVAEANPSQTLAIGEVVADKYRIERLLGSGGMAEVYAAINIRTERRVALKWILPALAASPEVLARFRREALAAGRINHPNVVTIFDVVEHQSSACLVMEMLSGETLAQRMKRTGPMAFVEAVAIMLPAMRGVAAAHFHGVIHRDLKPDNIFLCMDADGSIRDCKVLDFGVSKLTVADAATTGDITLSGNVVGTPEYMAPEQVRAGKHADHRVDIYSMGVVFYEMLAGRPPFVGEHFSGLMLDIMQRDPPPLASLRTDVPRRLAGVIHRALARELDRRYADMQTFILAVEAVGRDELKLAMGTPAEGLITQIAMPRLTPDGQYPVPKARRGVAAAIAVGLGVAAGGALLWLDTRREPHPEVAAPAQAQPSAQPPAAAPLSAPAEPVVAAPPADPAAAAEAPSEEPKPRAPEPAALEVSKRTRAASPRPGRPASRTAADGREPAKGEKGEVVPATARPAPPTIAPARTNSPSSPSNQKARAGKLSVDDF